MAKLGISTGITPNDGLGDSLLDGAIKINSNFSEIYSHFGNGTNLTSIGGTWTSTSVGIHTLKNVGIGTTNPTSKLTVSGDGKFVGVVTATSFSGSGLGLTNLSAEQLIGTLPAIDGSALTGLIAVGSGVIVKDSGVLVGTAVTIDFGNNLTVSPISAGVVTITATGGGSSQFVTTSAGIHTLSNVGIGTTNPQYTLDVNGDINFEGSLYQNADLFVASRWTAGTGDDIYKLNGNVGIGTTNPTSALTVIGNVNVSGVSTFVNILNANGGLNVSGVSTFVNILNANGGLNVSGLSTFTSTEVNFTGNIILGNTTKASNTFVRVLSGDNHNAGLEAYGNSQGTGFLFVGESSLVGGGVAYNGNGVPAFSNGETADTIAFYRKNAGTNEVVFSYPNNSNTVTFRGSVSATDLNSTSDENLKYDIRKVENSVSLLNEINGIMFKWKSNNKPSIGVIAQEVEKVFPELISNGEVKSVNYNGLIGVLIEAVKEQSIQINILKTEIEKLKK